MSKKSDRQSLTNHSEWPLQPYFILEAKISTWGPAMSSWMITTHTKKTIGCQQRWSEEGAWSGSRDFPAHFEAFNVMITILLWIGKGKFESSFSLVHFHHLIHQTQNDVMQMRIWTTDGWWTNYTRMNSTEAEPCERNKHNIEGSLSCFVEWTQCFEVKLWHWDGMSFRMRILAVFLFKHIDEYLVYESLITR
jgi:hypothetical protein